MATPLRCIAFALALALACSLAFPSSCLSSPTMLSSMAKSYPSAGLISMEEGTASVWMYLQKGGQNSFSIFQTDDLRFSMYLDTSHWSGRQYLGPRIVARAGGNKPASWGDVESYPEAYIVISEDEYLSSSHSGWYSEVRFPESEWHLVTMKWKGSPNGNVSIYFDGKLAGTKAYSSESHNDGHAPFTSLLVGFQPGNGVEIGNISFYPCALDGYEILALAGTGNPSAIQSQSAADYSSDRPPAPPEDHAAVPSSLDSLGTAIQAKQRVLSFNEFYSDGKKYLNVTSIRTVYIFYGLIPIDVIVQSKVDAETTEVVEQSLPWWYSLVAD